MSETNAYSSLRVLAIGAHPDDCDLKAGGCAILWAQEGASVRFVSMTDGSAGHHEQSGKALADRRKTEAKAAGEVAGIEYQVLDNPDGQLMPGLEERWELLRLIREFRPDLILTHRPNDYHPDHRYTSQLVQDCSYLVSVPYICPESPRLEKAPVIAYFRDSFRKPTPFVVDVAAPIDSVMEAKVRMLDCHESQFYEWLPWIDQHGIQKVGKPDEKLVELRRYAHTFTIPDEAARKFLIRQLGDVRGCAVVDAESFEISEFGAPLAFSAISRLFPTLRQ